MGAATAAPSPSAEDAAASAKGGRKRLLLLAVPVVLSGIGAGLWFGGILPPLLGMGKAGVHAEGEAAGPPEGEAKAKPPSFAEMPEIVANLNAGARRTVYVKLRSRLELARPEDEAAVQAAMPRLLDMFQTYLREMRPEELRGSAGTYRLREELIARANVAAAPARVVDVLFTELLIQ
ncbi:flagellar basal body-associated FliL family protein [Limobrevibacterium gyesilva]|uniref:Flagellar protein FliL n=1 Tax=Limobrevibacterium gyesilva TaxID=2991712 RepID=A0AA42CEC7_9PROT|nr:flagellar basal body-associated FliL family protein [Limobrevibacterium gyesilva]MCW3475114.1 flagellar basal body-associated FliL family protein [Limobrevibacterium gyesilva]